MKKLITLLSFVLMIFLPVSCNTEVDTTACNKLLIVSNTIGKTYTIDTDTIVNPCNYWKLFDNYYLNVEKIVIKVDTIDDNFIVHTKFVGSTFHSHKDSKYLFKDCYGSTIRIDTLDRL